MPDLAAHFSQAHGLIRIAVIAGVAAAAVVLVHGIRRLGQRLIAARIGRSYSKLRSLASLIESATVFAVCVAAIGLALRELGISLTAYLASVSVVGLAIAFGSQGLVQDVVTGLTLVLSDAFDIGDMVEISGQTGVVERIGMRFTTLTNFAGAAVLIPNRSITNVVAYPRGYVRAYVDVELPGDAARAEQAVWQIAESAREQFPGILVAPPSLEGRAKTPGGAEYLRVKFRLWPGQGALIEGIIRPRMVSALRALDPDYADWRVAVTYRAEPRPTAPRS